MPDPIQSSSRTPIPQAQTILGANDKTVVNSNRSNDVQRDTVQTSKDDKRRDSFEDYLNQTKIMTEKKANKTFEVDPAEDIASNSVYAAPGRSSPL